MLTLSAACAYASRDAYLNRPNQFGAKVSLGGEAWQIVDYASGASGFHGTAYLNPVTRQIIVAFRGTDVHHLTIAPTDILADVALATGDFPPQARDAVDFVKRVMANASLTHAVGHPQTDIVITGHSAGGTMAQVVCHRLGLHGHTFSAYGAEGVLGAAPRGRRHGVINHVSATDPVAAAARHYGAVRVYATQEDIHALRTAGYPDRGKFLRIVARRFSQAHAITNFAPDSGEGILSPSCRTRAARYASTIGRFRADVFRASRRMAISARLPFSPTWLLAVAAKQIRRQIVLVRMAIRAVNALAVRMLRQHRPAREIVPPQSSRTPRRLPSPNLAPALAARCNAAARACQMPRPYRLTHRVGLG